MHIFIENRDKLWYPIVYKKFMAFKPLGDVSFWIINT